MKTVEVEVKVKLTLNIDDNEQIADAIDKVLEEMDSHFGVGTDECGRPNKNVNIQDTEITDWTVLECNWNQE